MPRGLRHDAIPRRSDPNRHKRGVGGPKPDENKPDPDRRCYDLATSGPERSSTLARSGRSTGRGGQKYPVGAPEPGRRVRARPSVDSVDRRRGLAETQNGPQRGQPHPLRRRQQQQQHPHVARAPMLPGPDGRRPPRHPGPKGAPSHPKKVLLLHPWFQGQHSPARGERPAFITSRGRNHDVRGNP